MSDQFYTILTSLGKAKIANSGALGTKLNFVRFKVGDGGGAYYNPTETQTDVKNKVWEGNISSISIDESNPSWIVIETVIPTLEGGFTIREAGIFDDENNLIAIGKYPATYKPIAAEGSSKDLMIRMILEVSNAESINLKVDPTVILATKKDIQTLESKIQETNAQLSDLTYQTAGGTATALTLTTQTLVNGYARTFIASANNSGNTTTINGKKLYKPATTNTPTLIKDKAYTVWYNASGDNGNGCFFIKASVEGTALASDVRKNKTFSNDNDTDIVGGLDLSLLVSGNIRAGITIDGVAGKSSIVDTADATVVANHILAGKTAYKNGAKVTGTMVDRAGDTACVSSSVSGTTLKLRASNGYRDGVDDNVTITDSNFIASNIVSGKSIFGVAGSVIVPNVPSNTKIIYGSYVMLKANGIYNPTNSGGGWAGSYYFTSILPMSYPLYFIAYNATKNSARAYISGRGIGGILSCSRSVLSDGSIYYSGFTVLDEPEGISVQNGGHVLVKYNLVSDNDIMQYTIVEY